MKKWITIYTLFIVLGAALSQSKPFNNGPILVWSEQDKDSVVNWTGLDSLEESFFHRDTLYDINGMSIIIDDQRIQGGLQRLREFRCR